MLRCALGVLLLVSTGFAQDSSRMDGAVQSYVPHNKFTGSVLVARDNHILLSRGYGYADIKSKIPNTPQTKFRLGSVTKQFTAAAILLLEERGELHIRNPIRKYLPEMPAAWDKITIYHVLTHTSGIPDMFNVSPEFLKSPHTPEQLVALFRDQQLEFVPGQRMRYSNAGYLLLGYLIEKVSGQRYQDFLQKNIFTPLGMKDSGYDTDSALVGARRALGYSAGRNGPVRAPFWDMSNPYSAGGIYSTTEDLLRWEQALFKGELISGASLSKMIKPYISGYALGLDVGTVRGRRQISHTGRIPGFNTYLGYFPESKITVAVLSNVNGNAPYEIAPLLISLAHGDTVVIPSDLKRITLSAGILLAIVAAAFFVCQPRIGQIKSQPQSRIVLDASEPVIEVRNLAFSYSSLEVLHGISFRVRRGEMVGLLGPNGAGKSTTLKILAGIHPAIGGKVHMAGFDMPEKHLDAKKITGYLPESALLYECLSGTEFLELMGRLQGLDERTLHSRIRALLEAFELNNVRVPRMSGYSKGMRQKILISAALIHDPDILLLDEPLSGLDIETSILIKDLLMTLCAKGKTVLYSSHVLDVVEKVCHRVIVIDHGNILADAPLEELKARTGEESLELIFRKLTQSEDTGPKTKRVMEALQS